MLCKYKGYRKINFFGIGIRFNMMQKNINPEIRDIFEMLPEKTRDSIFLPDAFGISKFLEFLVVEGIKLSYHNVYHKIINK